MFKSEWWNKKTNKKLINIREDLYQNKIGASCWDSTDLTPNLTLTWDSLQFCQLLIIEEFNIKNCALEKIIIIWRHRANIYFPTYFDTILSFISMAVHSKYDWKRQRSPGLMLRYVTADRSQLLVESLWYKLLVESLWQYCHC